MLFNSNAFLVFIVAFMAAYVLCRSSLKARNGLILLASYLFYGWWDPRFLALIVFSSGLDFAAGRGMARARTRTRRRLWLLASLAGNLGVLGFFKYADFFIDSAVSLAAAAGLDLSAGTLGFILPVGISFYTFQTLSYTIDVYRGRMEPAGDLLAFMAYVAYFPQLVAGPIERARRLLPQFMETRRIDAAMIRAGIWLCLWGMFKKVVIADNLAPMVDLVYGMDRPGSVLILLGTLAFAVQIYGDFSGYSNIARGLAKCMGFDLMVNFDIPYAASNLRDFWRRWHISLSTWLRDYLYIPLGGSRRGPRRTRIHLMITMLLGGLWHGAAWHFVAWGLWHGAGLVLVHARLRDRDKTGEASPSAAGWIATQLFVLYGWVLFRAESIGHAASLTAGLLNFALPPYAGSFAIRLALFSAPLIAMEIWQRRTRNPAPYLALPGVRQGLLQGLLLWGIIVCWQGPDNPFLYFQF